MIWEKLGAAFEHVDNGASPVSGIVLASGLSRLIDMLKAAEPRHVPHGTDIGPGGYAVPVEPDPTKPKQLRVGRVKPFAIISAFRPKYSHAANMKRSGSLLKQINRLLDKPGAYKLIGWWQNMTDEAVKLGLSWQDAKSRGMLQEPTAEESYLVVKPATTDYDDFRETIVELGRWWDQEGVLVGDGQQVFNVDPKNGDGFPIGTGLTAPLLAGAYSRMKNKPDVPFVFAGTLQPTSPRGGHLYAAAGLSYVTTTWPQDGTQYSDMLGRAVMADIQANGRSS
jgi:hypothetical protein